MQRYDEVMHLKDYLNFIFASREYEAKLATVNKDVEELCKKFIHDKFYKLNVAEKTREKTRKVDVVPGVSDTQGMASSGFSRLFMGTHGAKVVRNRENSIVTNTL